MAARQGIYPGAVAARAWTVRFRNVARPAGVTVNGQPVSGWTYDAAGRTITVRTPVLPTSAQVTVAHG